MRLQHALYSIALLLMPFQLMAADKTEISIQSMEVIEANGVYKVNGSVDFIMRNPVLEALNNGVTLEIVVDHEILLSRRWWLDKEVAIVSQRYRLSYHALTRQYVLTNLNTQDVNTFYTLPSLLGTLGDISEFPLIDTAVLDDDELYLVRMRVYLDFDELPLPLRIRAYSTSAWRPDSGWKVWPLH